MTKPKSTVSIKLPRKGGSYVADAGTGKLKRMAETKPAAPRPAQPDATAPETKEG